MSERVAEEALFALLFFITGFTIHDSCFGQCDGTLLPTTVVSR